MKQYLKKFIYNDEGAEVLEWGVVMGICVAVLIAVLVVIVAVVRNKMLDAGKQIDEAGTTGGTSVDWDAQKADVDSALEALN